MPFSVRSNIPGKNHYFMAEFFERLGLMVRNQFRTSDEIRRIGVIAKYELFRHKIVRADMRNFV